VLNVPLAWKSFWALLMELLGDVGQVEACFGMFGDSVNLAQDRCIVWDEHTISLEIILGTPDGTPR
jgi:hypothetical protein